MSTARQRGKMLQLQSEETANNEKEARAMPEQILQEVRKDMGKVAILISILAVVLMVTFYFSLQYNMADIDNKVSELYSMKDQVVTMEERLTELEKLPQQTRNIIYGNMLEELSLKASYLSDQLEGHGKAQVKEAQDLLKQAQGSLGK